jgi:putative tricarboxylic transport membrane protein
MIENILNGFAHCFIPLNMFMMVFGLLAGMVFGSLPGFTATMGVAVLVPLTYWVPAEVGLNLLSAIFCGAIYGGSITAILLRIPGTPASVPTSFDGYALTQQGQPARALGMSTLSSAAGGLLGALALMFFAPILAMAALKFGPPEIMALAIFGLSVVSILSPGNLVKGLIACLVGLLMGVVGQDPLEGYPRLTYGQYQLLGGFPLVPVLIGLFSIPPAIDMAEHFITNKRIDKVFGSLWVSLKDFKHCCWTIIRGSLIGIGIGIIPAAGPDIAAFVAYNDGVRRSKNPERFGKGEIAGVAAPEAANNGCTGGSLIPLLTLGIPGSPPAAIFLGALFIHGLRPGPMIFDTRPEVGFTVIAGFVVINILMYFLGLVFCRLSRYVVQVPANILAPIIVVLTVVGSYAIDTNMFDVWVMLISGLVGYGMQRTGYPLSPICLALILGPMLESELTRTNLMFHGNYLLFYTRPIAALLLLLSVVMFFWPWISKWMAGRRMAKANA